MNRLLFAVALLGACGSDAVPQGDDDVPDPPGSGPRFNEDVAPIFITQCATCHREGGAGPFPLVTFDDASAVADLIPSMVANRQMPPFNADNSGDCNTYKDARWLSDDQIATVVAWADGDRLEGDPATAPALPALPPGLARVDATATMTEAYSPAFARPDDYRCFIVDPAIASDTFLTGFEVRRWWRRMSDRQVAAIRDRGDLRAHLSRSIGVSWPERVDVVRNREAVVLGRPGQGDRVAGAYIKGRGRPLGHGRRPIPRNPVLRRCPRAYGAS